MDIDDLQALDRGDVQHALATIDECDPSIFMLRYRTHRDWPLAAMAEQLRCRPSARRKVPEWLAAGTLFARQALEQCTRSAVARYKASRFPTQVLVDSCAGLGVDAQAFAAAGATVTACETDQLLHALLARNRHRLAGGDRLTPLHIDGTTLLDRLDRDTAVYLDPDRRSGGRRQVAIAAGRPDATRLWPVLRARGHRLLIKLSPAVDLASLQQHLPAADAIEVLSHGGECREVLVAGGYDSRPGPCAVVLNEHGAERYRLAPTGEPPAPIGPPAAWLLLPDPAIRKAGLAGLLAQRSGAHLINAQSPWCSAETRPVSWPGQILAIQAVLPSARKHVRRYLREHGLRTAQLMRSPGAPTIKAIERLFGLRHGGRDHLLFTIDHEDRGMVVHARSGDASDRWNR